MIDREAIRASEDAITYAWGLTEQQWLDRVQSAVARADAAEAHLAEATAVIDAIDHATYGWSFATAVAMVDKIRVMARAFLAALPESEA